MRKLLLLLFIPIVQSTSAQINLVHNSGFEQHTDCPSTVDAVKYATYWNAIDTSWSPGDSAIYDPGCLPDYINGCSLNAATGEPINGHFYQYPHSGNGMMQVAMYWNDTIPFVNERDYLQGRLSSTLVAGQSYCVTFYTVMDNGSSYAVNHIGAYFDDGTIDTTTTCGQPQTEYTPQILDTAIINDTLNWIRIQGSFVANGTERFITIGNFFDTAHTAHIRTRTGLQAIYLIDDVSVISSDAHAYAGPDKYAATGDTVSIGLDSNGAGMPCYWYVLGGTAAIDSGGTIRVRAMGIQTYVVSMDLCGTITYDTVTVTDTGCAGLPAASFMYNGGPVYAGNDTLSFSYTGTGAVDSAHWDFGDGSTGTGFTTTHAYAVPPDSFNVCLMVYGPCGNDTICQWVHTIVCTVPTAAFSQTVSGTSVSFAYSGTTLYADSIIWYLGDGHKGYGTLPFTYTYAAEGTYTVCVIAYSRCGNDTGCNVVMATLEAQNIRALEQVKIYPNPVGDEVHVDGMVQGASYRILNMTGECVQQGILAQRNNTLSLKGFAPGVYILEMTGEDGARRMVRLLKE